MIMQEAHAEECQAHCKKLAGLEAAAKEAQEQFAAELAKQSAESAKLAAQVEELQASVAALEAALGECQLLMYPSATF